MDKQPTGEETQPTAQNTTVSPEMPMLTPSPTPLPSNDEQPHETNISNIPEPAGIPEAENWGYSNSGTGSGMPATMQLQDEISWQAAEFVAHDKPPKWYLALGGAGVLATAIIYLLTKDTISTVVVVVIFILFGVYAGRKPRILPYRLNSQSLVIGEKMYLLQDYRFFTTTLEAGVASVVFMPMKRFLPPLTIYLNPDTADQVVEFLGGVLPVEEHHQDVVEALLRRIRF